MKHIFILISCLFILSGCSEKKKTDAENSADPKVGESENVEAAKKDNSKTKSSKEALKKIKAAKQRAEAKKSTAVPEPEERVNSTESTTETPTTVEREVDNSTETNVDLPSFEAAAPVNQPLNNAQEIYPLEEPAQPTAEQVPQEDLNQTVPTTEVPATEIPETERPATSETPSTTTELPETEFLIDTESPALPVDESVTE